MQDRREDEVPLQWGRRQGRPARKKAAGAIEPRIPRITRLMALTIKFEDMIARGEVRDYAEIARLGFVTRARLTQIMNLLLLAPEIQEAILMQAGIPDFMTTGETKLRRLTTIADWGQQKLVAKGLGLRLA
ncbi:MAG: hypothetical protein FJW30_17640 [Acidobacteria bacterium]|nr:hypothetical protein [Acidobacteriota bacterium]